MSFTYEGSDRKILNNINLTVQKGEFLVLCGLSGSGKSTLLRCLKPPISPKGTMQGKISMYGMDLTSIDAKTQSKKIGFVSQSFDNQTVTAKVWSELAFGLESIGTDPAQIKVRVSEMASFFGIGNWLYKDICELSGGARQLLNLASAMAVFPDALILDEPSNQLDPIASADFLALLGKINAELGTTIIIAEHNLSEILSYSSRVAVMDNQTICACLPPRDIAQFLAKTHHPMFSAMPVPSKIYFNVNAQLNNPENVHTRPHTAHIQIQNVQPVPLNIAEGRKWLNFQKDVNGLHPLPCICNGNKSDFQNDKISTLLKLKDIRFKYSTNAEDIIKGLSFDIEKGEISAILGSNGSGKTSLLSIIGGLNKPYGGKIIKSKGIRFALLPQNPQAVFVKSTVYSDLLDCMDFNGTDNKNTNERLTKYIRFFKLDNLLDKHPYDLSGGEQQRLALAKLMLIEPDILLLDEPTKGLDAEFKQFLGQALRKLCKSGTSAVIVSHDIEFCAQFADSCSLLFDGKIISKNPPRQFFCENCFYTTAAVRLANGIIADAATENDIFYACTGIANLSNTDDNAEALSPFETDCHYNCDENIKKRPLAGRLIDIPPKKQRTAPVFLIMLFILSVFLTILIGKFIFSDRKYYITSLLIVFETFCLFIASFEKSKPEVRKIVIISVLCAICVISRAAFFMLPQFKPASAIVIISGAAFGGEAGFLVGAVSAFVSNFIFGQGPWTPWQMLAFGLIGLISGILFRNTKRIHIYSLSAFGFLVTFILYGFIMNISTVMISQTEITLPVIVAALASGIPLDIIHGLSTSLFLFIAAGDIMQKLYRIVKKFDI